jgi:pimeloyl-ACP methyl ester carboxylesterase
MKRFLALLAVLAMACGPSLARTGDKIGVVLMHGKQGSPLGTAPLTGNKAAIGGRLIADLKSAGYLVATPEMCWSGRRGLDKTFGSCIAEIDASIADLKAHGATLIVVGGLSQGGNAAIAYGALHPELLGVIGMAPADDPTRKAKIPEVAAAIAKAQDLVARGKGDEKTSFDDVNTGPNGSFAMRVRTTADIYLSFYGPDSQAGIPENSAKLGVPLLWVAGDSDPTQRGGRKFAFDKAPPNPLNRYVTVHATHIETPNAGRHAVLAWLEEIARR